MDRVKAYAQLLRVPNVFTALADVIMGGLLTGGWYENRSAWLLLIAGSAAFYLAGMVLNDVYDFEVDQVERPERPLPSGRISLATARALGWGLMSAGLGCAFGSAALRQPVATNTLIAAGALAAAIVAYDAWLKSTPLGPVAMGTCRALNVMLGASVAADGWAPLHFRVALGLGVYVAGITWFARTEAETSNRTQLALATLVMMAGIGTVCTATQREWFAARQGPVMWSLLWVALSLPIALRTFRAVGEPAPENVQRAVKHAIMSLIVIDAAAALGAIGPQAMFLLALLPPAMLLGRWVYST
ncbi:MAG: UbiA family prenyltransferase [Planctomycetes bacterium]|nr:UbiA family prenyltransferase [Planctomycetota bacterium]